MRNAQESVTLSRENVMQRGLSDTDPTVEQLQIELLRRAGMERRIQLAAEMSAFALEAAFAALRRRHPHLTEREIGALFVEYHYGAALAAGVRTALAARDSEHVSVS